MSKAASAVAVNDAGRQGQTAVQDLTKTGIVMKTISIPGSDDHTDEHGDCVVMVRLHPTGA